MPPAGEDQFKYVPLLSLTLGNGDEVLYREDSRTTRVVDPTSLDLLAACGSFRTLGQHARQICAAAGLPDEDIALLENQLGVLSRNGLLVSRRELLDLIGRGAGDPAPPAGISALGVLVVGTGRTVNESLAGCLEIAKSRARPPELVVVGSSPSREALRDLKSRHGAAVAHIGPEEQVQFRNRLSRECGLPAEIVTLALPEGFSAGAIWNLFLLETAGGLAVAVTDDTMCRPRSVPGDRGPALAFASGPGSVAVRHYPDREAALRECPALQTDFLAAHEEFLGRTVRSCAAREPERDGIDLEGIDLRFIRWLRDGDARVGLTQSGFVGDCGRDSPAWLLVQSRAARQRLIQSRAEHEVARSSPEIVTSSLQPTVDPLPFDDFYAAGLDNRGLLPPFPPGLAGAHRLFATALRQCFPKTLGVHLPWVVSRSPVRTNEYAAAGTPAEFTRLSTSELLVAFLQSLDMGPAKPEGKERLQTLGRHLSELSALPLPEFEDIVRKLLWLRRSGTLDLLEQQIHELKGQAPLWTEDVRRSLDALRGVFTAEKFLPHDLPGGAGLEGLRSLVANLGRLLYAWPDLIEAAKVLRAKEIRPAKPV